jgi:glutamate-ammonia-ligase adenylyltransferase
VNDRTDTLLGKLARLGFSDLDRAQKLVGELAEVTDGFAALVRAAAQSPDPDSALYGLAELGRTVPDRLREIADQEPWRNRVIAVLGGSQALGQHLVAHPEVLEVLAVEPRRSSVEEIRARLFEYIGAPQMAQVAAGSLSAAVVENPEAADLLRLANRRELVRIAARDLMATDPFAALPGVAAELADLADGILACALAIARGKTPGHEHCRLAIVALGKCGAQELNYISDIDVLYVAEPADEDTTPDQATTIGGQLAGHVARICSEATKTGSIWQVDAALRPEGKAGPLARTLDSMATYYQKWASNWEFQAMLKARAAAGDLVLGQQFVDLVRPLVWHAGERPGFVNESRAMRKRVIALLPANEANREIKLGAGGLRDVEFSVQLLQLVHGRADDRLRERATLPALTALVEHGYIGRKDGEELSRAYRFERVLEHRQQLYRMRRTHLMPTEEPELRRLARSVGIQDADTLTREFRSTQSRVTRLHERVFYSPLLEAVAHIPTEALRLTSDAAADRLAALDFADPQAALRHIESLTTGVSRTVEIQRQLMPAMLGWLAEGPNPDAGLLAFRQLSDAMGTTAWYLRALRDEGATAENLSRILSSSRYIVDLLARDPASAQLLTDTDELVPKSRDELDDLMDRVLTRHDDAEVAAQRVRGLRRRELFRLAVGDVLGLTDLDSLGTGLSDLAGATVGAALRIARHVVPDSPEIGVIAMGRWGGGELNYSSDADAMFVVPDDTPPDGIRAATQAVSKLRGYLRAPGPEPALDLDPDLRPEGKNGPLVRTSGSYLAYYANWSITWESQALLRAGYGAGPVPLVQALLDGIANTRWPDGGISDGDVLAIRKLKMRMERERTGSDPLRNIKLGRGGLSDIEWTVQLLQLQYAADHPGLRTTGTMWALHAAVEDSLVEPQAAERLATAWRMASRIRNAVMLVRGRPSDALPSDAREVAAVAALLGYGKGEASTLLEDWAKASRRATKVVDELFWGN